MESEGRDEAVSGASTTGTDSEKYLGVSAVPYVGWLAHLLPGSKPPPERDIKEPSRFQITMLLHELGKQQTQIRFKMQKDGEPVWDQTVIDRLWVTTQREAMIESGPPAEKAAVMPPPSVGQDNAKIMDARGSLLQLNLLPQTLSWLYRGPGILSETET